MPDAISGFLNIHKPQGLTSHDVVARIRRLTRQAGLTRKVGHAGTLDPMATGVLVVCLGQATRLSEYVMHGTKVYAARICFGVETDTYDADGTILSSSDVSHLTEDAIRAATGQFIGEIDQIPPIYSAIKQGGKPLYELARAGLDAELTPRRVTIHALEILAWEAPFLSVRVTCAAGTYIRSLAHDLGDVLGTGAHLDRLERVRSGTFDISAAISLETLEASSDLIQYVVTPQEALREHPARVLSDVEAQEIMQGRSIPNPDESAAPLLFSYLPDGWLLAVLENRGTVWKPHKVFLPQT